MPLEQSVERELLHTRNIICHGYQRTDGLWDIEARLVDTKNYDFSNKDRGGIIRTGEALHDLYLRLTLDNEMFIIKAESFLNETPYNFCKQAGKNTASLEGLQIAPGWMRKARQRVGGSNGCTHLTEMLKTIATTAFQTFSIERHKNIDPQAKPLYFNSCMTHASDSPVTLRDTPEFYTGK